MTLQKKISLYFGLTLVALLVIESLVLHSVLSLEDLTFREAIFDIFGKAVSIKHHVVIVGMIVASSGLLISLFLLLGLLIHRLLIQKVTTPIQKIDQDLRGISRQGNRKARLDLSVNDDLANLGQSINEVLDDLDQADKGQAYNEQRYRTVLNQSSEGILIVDMRTQRLIECNKTAMKLLGIDDKDFTCLKLSDLPDDGKPWIERPIQDMERTGLPYYIEKHWHHPNGEIVYAEINMRRIDINQEKLLIINIHDITRHRQIEQQIRIREQKLTAENQALTDLARKRHHPNQSLKEKFEAITAKTAEIIQGHHVGIWQYDSTIEGFREIDGFELRTQRHEISPSVSSEQLGAIHQRVLDERTVVIADVENSPDYKDLQASLFQPRSVGAVVLVCIHNDGQPWGALSIQMNGVTRDWIPEDVHFAVSMADYAALCIQETERDKAQQALIERERRFTLMAENVPDILYRIRIEPELCFEYISSALESITGYKPSELYENPNLSRDWIHPVDLAKISQSLQNPKEQKKSFIIRLNHRDGHRVWLEQCTVYIHDDDGKVIAMEGISRDITKRKLREKELSYRLSIEEVIADASRVLLTPQGGDLEWILRRLGECVQANRAYIFEFEQDCNLMSNTYEWCDKETEPMIDQLQGIPTEETPWFYHQVSTQKVLIIPDIDQLAKMPEAATSYEVLSSQSILSLVIVPIRDNEARLRGFLGFDDTCRRRNWSVEDIRILTVVAEMIGNYWERQRSEKALLESQRTLSNLISNIPGMAYRCKLDENWTMAFVSQACEELTGYPPESLIMNREVSYSDLIHPEDRQYVMNHVERAVITQKRFNLEYRIIDKHKKVRWVAESGCALWDHNEELIGLDGLITDISQQRRAQQALKDSEKRHRLLADNLTDIIWSVNLDYQYTYISPAVYQVRGYTPQEAMHQSWWTILHPDDQPKLKALINQIEQLKVDRLLISTWKATLEVQLRHKDGHFIWTEVKITTLTDDNGQAIGFLGVSRDISERKLAEIERIRLEARIQQAQKLESLGLMAGGVAHDFNNLLMGVLGNAGLLSDMLEETSPMHDRVKQIELAARRAAELTNQMLAYSGQSQFKITRVDINEMIPETIELLQSVISSKATVERCLDEQSLVIEADASKIRQVIMNLITNASDALGDEEGIIRIETGRIDADRDFLSETYLTDELKEGSYTLIRIIDTGCGMDVKTRHKIFDPFFTTKFTGRGLGLAAVLGIVRSHHGAIQVESQPGKGTTFNVLLPCATTEEKHSPEPQSIRRSDWHAEGLILVADDENLIRNIASEVLQIHGFSVVTACDGLEAMDIFEKHSDKIRAVLLDLVMPRMDGAETYQRLKKARPDLPIILSSGYCQEDVANRFPADAFLDFIQKPYLPNDLIEKFKQMLQNDEALESKVVD